jgi:proteic killer suppression protein
MVLSPSPFRLAARAEGFRTRGNIDLLAAIERMARRKLYYFHRARTLRDLQAPPGNRLEALAGGRRGQHSIRINDQWRVRFRRIEGEAHDVEIVDYH